MVQGETHGAVNGAVNGAGNGVVGTNSAPLHCSHSISRNFYAPVNFDKAIRLP